MGYSPLVYAYEQHDVAITGKGTLDGQADAEHWWPWKKNGHPQSQKPDRDRLFAQAEAGVDVCAPSGMMDGQVLAIRDALDEESFEHVAILAYAAKYASALYGPFREAVDSSLTGDRKTYQQDPANRREGLREAILDLAEGADIVMVKPASLYLDVLADVAAVADVPVWAYQVSGEYAMVEAAAANGWIDRDRAVV